MDNKRVAVIMSVYQKDRLDFLKESIESILNQTYKDVDIYLICDGKLGIELDSYLSSQENESFHVNRRQENKGLATSLNELLEIVLKMDYEFIARMDADDISELDRFAKQINFLINHPDIDMVGGAIREIDFEGKVRGKIVKYPCEPNECRSFFSKRNPVAHPTVMFRRRYFEKTGCYYPTDFVRNEDTRLWHEGYKHGCVIANLPDILLNFRVTDDMFKQRRNGKEFAKSQLQLRRLIAKDLGFGIMAYVYAYATYLLMISPSWILKMAYRILR